MCSSHAASDASTLQLSPEGASFTAASIEVVAKGTITDLYSMLNNPLDVMQFGSGKSVTVAVELLADTDPTKRRREAG